MNPVQFRLVDGFFKKGGGAPGAARRTGHRSDQQLSIRCPACAKIARFPIAPRVGSQGQTWTPTDGRAGFGLVEALVFPCGDWRGYLRGSVFVPLDQVEGIADPDAACGQTPPSP
jgi:hypothetical protein